MITSENPGQIAAIFEQQVEKSGDRLALKGSNAELTYRELNERANGLAQQLADALPKEGAARQDQTVGMLFEHDTAMIVGILAILKAGGIYVPLDPTYPPERLAEILEDSTAPLMVTNTANWPLAQQLREKANRPLQVINMDRSERSKSRENLGMEILPEQIAYIMYTSGSTGKPKGIVQTHQNIVHFTRDFSDNLAIHPADRIALFTSYSHTVSAIDIFSALLNGAALYPYDIKSAGSLERLTRWMIDKEITVYHSVPTLYRYWLDSLAEGAKEQFPHLRLVIVGGEEVFKRDVDLYKTHFSADCIFVNLFGASELIIATSYLIDNHLEMTRTTVPVGYPAAEVEVFLLDEKDEEAGVFGVGELVYQSRYLSPGYWRRQDKTAEVFVKNPLTGQGRVYRSGDLGRILPDGSIEYLGRKDFQVKIRGHRVELSEIETLLDDIDGIRGSVVTSTKNEKGELELAAYYETKDKKPREEGELKQILRRKLPGYMIPSYIAFLEHLPLTPNGKIDRGKLPAPRGLKREEVEYVPPRDEMEEKILALWQEILNLEKIGVKDNFFALGGHSLDAAKLISRLHKQFNIELMINDILDNQTIESVGLLLREKIREQRKLEEILRDIEQNQSD